MKFDQIQEQKLFSPRYYVDQLNCSKMLDSPLLCKVSGYDTFVSKYALCKGTSLCDDRIENVCVTPEGGCHVHKHQLCDGYKDCASATDEKEGMCSMTNTTCQRKLSYRRPEELNIPLSWVMDGVVDCRNGIDEDPSHWKSCGNGWKTRYTEINSPCFEVFLCQNQKFMEFSRLCDSITTCPEESSICSSARSKKEFNKNALKYNECTQV